MKTILKLICAIGAIGLSSCDDGDITDDIPLNMNDGYVVKMTGKLNNLTQWDNEKYQVVIAAFAAQDSYPLLAKKIPTTDGPTDFTFEGIDLKSETIELCVLNTINKRIATLATLYDKGETPEHKPNDTIYFNGDNKDVGVYASIQQNIFNKRCTYCHGLGETPAAGLYLTENESYKNLFNQPSKKVEGAMRVTPGNGEESVLYRILTEYNENSTWHYDHTRFFYGNTMSNLVKEWINNGASQ